MENKKVSIEVEKLNANDIAGLLSRKLNRVVLHQRVDEDVEENDELFIILSQTNTSVEMTFIVDIHDYSVYRIGVRELGSYSLDKYLKIIDEVMKIAERGE